ncbi:MAG: hypothetical protein ACK4Q5_16040 [Saprospiraceae bacterium]
MKTNLLGTLTLAFFLSIAQSASAANTPSDGHCPDVRVIVGEKKIWFVGDETPVASFNVRILNASGAVVMEKKLSSKMTDWSLDVSALDKGDYRIQIGDATTAQFSR